MKRAKWAIIIPAVLIAGGVAWFVISLNWPGKPDPVMPQASLKTSKPVRIAVVSEEKPFSYTITDLVFTSCAATPQQLEARAVLRIFTYAAPGQDVQKITARMPEQGLVADLDDHDKDGVWRATVNGTDLPVDTDMPLQLKFYGADDTLLRTSDHMLTILAPEYCPVKFWREPAGSVTPGEPVAFKLDLNEQAILRSTIPQAAANNQITVNFEPILRLEDSLKGKRSWEPEKHYESGYNWHGMAGIEPGKECPVVAAFKMGHQGEDSFELTLDPLILDYTPVAFADVSFDPPLPLKRGSTVEVTVTTDKPVTKGEVAFLLHECFPVVLEGDGCIWSHPMYCGWEFDEWVQPELTYHLSHSLNGITLSAASVPVPIEPMPQPKIVEFTRTPDGPVVIGEVVTFKVMMEPQVDFGGIYVVLGQAVQPKRSSYYDHLAVLRRNSDGMWHGRIEWPEDCAPGNWGPLRAVYVVRSSMGNRFLYETDFTSEDFVVIKRTR